MVREENDKVNPYSDNNWDYKCPNPDCRETLLLKTTEMQARMLIRCPHCNCQIDIQYRKIDDISIELRIGRNWLEDLFKTTK